MWCLFRHSAVFYSLFSFILSSLSPNLGSGCLNCWDYLNQEQNLNKVFHSVLFQVFHVPFCVLYSVQCFLSCLFRSCMISYSVPFCSVFRSMFRSGF